MKIAVCGSMYFSKEMFQAKEILESLGHEVLLPTDVKECLEDPKLNMDLEYCIKTNIDKENFDQVAESDAILVLNYERNSIKGYIGGASLMELALARHLNKKIFLLFDPPEEKDLRYALEIKVTQPIILNGDLNKINEA